MHATMPLWVPFLLLGLLLLGYRQSRTRLVKPCPLAIGALAMCGFSFYGVLSTFGAKPSVLILWASAYVLALVFGANRVAPRGLILEGHLVRLPGSWTPMALILGIFFTKFFLGFATAAHLPVLQNAVFIAALGAVLGGLSGGFGAQALAVHRCAVKHRPLGGHSLAG